MDDDGDKRRSVLEYWRQMTSPRQRQRARSRAMTVLALEFSDRFEELLIEELRRECRMHGALANLTKDPSNQ